MTTHRPASGVGDSVFALIALSKEVLTACYGLGFKGFGGLGSRIRLLRVSSCFVSEILNTHHAHAKDLTYEVNQVPTLLTEVHSFTSKCSDVNLGSKSQLLPGGTAQAVKHSTHIPARSADPE